ncbi:MAG TPA: amino acid permease, partial [Bacteroidetes bacterium]|nr:amino acid permease [Bacteroidota bacterium]
VSAAPSELVDTTKIVMADIAWQGWLLIPLGLAAATISSALGSIMVAPRTLQAIANDEIFPTPKFNLWLKKGKGTTNEPVNASIITVIIAAIFIMMGGINSVAKIISMFFMVTYGSLSLISFLNHFSADPSYRPTFKSRWYISLFGAIASFGLMFFMNPGYAVIAISLMIILYLTIAYYNKDKKNLALIFQGVIFQINHKIQVFLQKAEKEENKSWRPSIVAISKNSFKRLGGFDLLRWLSQKYGFGTYIHQIEGYLSKETHQKALEEKNRLIKMSELTKSNIFVDTLISPSYTSSIAQIIQLPGIAGTENNLLLFEFSKNDPQDLKDIIDNFNLITSVSFDVMILGASERGFGLKKEIHIWITPKDYKNANLMILIAYIIIGHPDWKGAEIKIFAIFPESKIDKEKNNLFELIDKGQLPISKQNITIISRKNEINSVDLINQMSVDADLTIVGFLPEIVKKYGIEKFLKYDKIGNILFIHNADPIEIK